MSSNDINQSKSKIQTLKEFSIERSNISQLSSPKIKPEGVLEKVIASRKAKTNYKIAISSEHEAKERITTIKSPQAVLSGSDQYFFVPSSVKMQNELDRKNKTVAANFFEQEKSYLFSSRALSDRIKLTKDNTSNEMNTLVSSNNTLPNITSKKFYYPYMERELGFEDLYRATEGLTKELHSILYQEYEDKLKTSIRLLNVREFSSIQRTRITNIVDMIEKRYVDKVLASSKVDQELWRIMMAEINRIRNTYEEFINHFDNTLDKVSKGKEKVPIHQTDAWEATNYLLEYSNLKRTINLTSEEFRQEGRLEKLAAKIEEFKITYKAGKNFNPKIFESFEKVQGHIEHLNELVEIEKANFEAVMYENQRLIETNKSLSELQKQAHESILRISSETKKASMVSITPEVPSYQIRYYEERVKDLELEKMKLLEKLAKDKTKKNFESKKSVLRDGLVVKTTQDKEVMVNVFVQDFPELKMNKLDTILFAKRYVLSGVPMQKNLMVAFINLIYSDKLITDFSDELERRPRKSLKQYLPEWFLKRFGLFSVSQIVMQDFALGIRNLAYEHDRFKMFLDFSGIFVEDVYDQIDIQVRKNYFATAEVLSIYYNLVYSVKFDFGSQANKFFHINTYGPFLPILNNSNDLMSIDVAKHVMHMLMIDYLFTPDETMAAEDRFGNLLGSDLYARVEDERMEDGSKFLRVDSFLRFMIDLIVERDLERVHKFFIGLNGSTQGRNNTNMTYNEFNAAVDRNFPHRTQAWKDHTYAKLFEDNRADEIPLEKLFPNVVAPLLDEDLSKKIYQSKFIKDAGGSKKTKEDLRLSRSKPSQNKEFKEAFTLIDNAYTAASYQTYDMVSSIVVLQEMYKMCYEKIKIIEKSHDHLFNLHDQFTKVLDRLPGKLIETFSNEYLSTRFKAEDLVDMIEQLWSKFREILSYTYR